MRAKSNVVAVVLAAGRGTRLRSRDTDESGATVGLRDDQDVVAETGIKALMPIRARGGKPAPFVAYTLDAIAHAGVRHVCFVVRPSLEQPERLFPTHSSLEVSFAVQHEPRGTADAVASAQARVQEQDLLVLNSDTFYPPHAIRQLVDAEEPALLALDGHRVAADAASNLSAQQMAQWAAVTMDEEARLGAVLDPPRQPPPSDGARWWVNVNAWRFDHRIFEACRELENDGALQSTDGSPRELELPRAVELSRTRGGVRYRVLPSTAPLLDLTARADIRTLEQLIPAMQTVTSTHADPSEEVLVDGSC